MLIHLRNTPVYVVLVKKQSSLGRASKETDQSRPF